MKTVLSLILTFVMLLSMGLSACAPAAPIETTEPSTEPQTTEYNEEIPDGYNQVIFYWNGSGPYDNCDVWAWWADKAGKGYLFHACDYGAKAIVNVPEGVEEVGFIVRKDCSDPGGSSWGRCKRHGR